MDTKLESRLEIESFLDALATDGVVKPELIILAKDFLNKLATIAVLPFPEIGGPQYEYELSVSYEKNNLTLDIAIFSDGTYQWLFTSLDNGASSSEENINLSELPDDFLNCVRELGK